MPKLTAAAVRKYSAGSSRREISDDGASGLYLVIQARLSASKSWALRFRRPDGRPAKLTLGSVDLAERETNDEPVIGAPLTLGQARELATQIDRKRKRGIDVVEEHKAARARKAATAADLAANTFGACLREFCHSLPDETENPPTALVGNRGRVADLCYKRDVDPATVEPEVIKASVAAIWADRPVALIDGHDVHTVVAEAHQARQRRPRPQNARRTLDLSFSVAAAPAEGHRANPCAEVAPGCATDRGARPERCGNRGHSGRPATVGPPLWRSVQLLLLTGAACGGRPHGARRKLSATACGPSPVDRTKNHRALSPAVATVGA